MILAKITDFGGPTKPGRKNFCNWSSTRTEIGKHKYMRIIRLYFNKLMDAD